MCRTRRPGATLVSSTRARRRADARSRRLRSRLAWNSWRSPTNAMERGWARMVARARLRRRQQIIAYRWPNASAVKRRYRSRRR